MPPGMRNPVCAPGSLNWASLQNALSGLEIGAQRKTPAQIKCLRRGRLIEKVSPGLSRAAALDFQPRAATCAVRAKSLAQQGFLYTERWPCHGRKRDVQFSIKWQMPLDRQPGPSRRSNVCAEPGYCSGLGKHRFNVLGCERIPCSVRFFVLQVDS